MNGGFAGAWFCQKLRAQRLEVSWGRQEGHVPSQGPAKHSHRAWGFSCSSSIWVCPSHPEEQRGGPHLQAAGISRERSNVSMCCPPTHCRWSQRERAVVRSTEAGHASPSHHLHLPERAGGAKPGGTRSWAGPSSQIHVNSSLPQGFRSQTRNQGTQRLNESSLPLRFNSPSQVCSWGNCSAQ